MRWESQRDGTAIAKSGQRIIGMVVMVEAGSQAGQAVWHLSGVTGLKYQAATQGYSATLDGGKRALRRAWRIWLDERGLAEGPEA